MRKCVCGSSESYRYYHKAFSVTRKGESQPADSQYATCAKCGWIRSVNGPESIEDFVTYYEKYPPSSPEYKAKTWGHDLDVAYSRCKEYGFVPNMSRNLLDVGSGSGAFVYVCRDEYGIDAVGCELSQYDYSKLKGYTYQRRFEDIHFPTDNFDFVTCHDVLEHSLNPIEMIREMFRITKQEGFVMIDFPRFFHEAGEHHWKDSEHIWFLNEDQLKQAVIEAGFEVKEIRNPIESKVVFYLQKPVQERPTMLLPPGFGDSYWSLVKLESFLDKYNIGLPDVTVVSDRAPKHNGHARSVPFLRLFPFIKSTGATVANDPRFRMVWREAYSKQGKTLFKGVAGFDYFLSYNGHLRFGERMEDIDYDLSCNWFPPMFRSLEQDSFKQYCEETFRKYMVIYLPFYGTYKYWTKQFPIERIIEGLRKIVKATGITPVFAGARWDADDADLRYVMLNVPGSVDLTGKTSVDQLFGLIQGSQLVVGFPSGLTIMATVLRKLTYIIWNAYYNMDFAWFSCPPEVRMKSYFINFTHMINSERFCEDVKTLLETGQLDCRYPIPEKTRWPRKSIEKDMGATKVAPMEDEVPVPVRLPSPLRRGKADTSSKPVRPVPSHPDPFPIPRRKSKAIPHLNNGKVRTNVVCILRSGGDFKPDHVRRLLNSVYRNTRIPFEFVCLTDMEDEVDFCKTLPLEFNWKGWWSKIELFKSGKFGYERVVFFDLDTVIVGNIDSLLTYSKAPFAALGTWRPEARKAGVIRMDSLGTGMMIMYNAGSAMSFLFDEFNEDYIRTCKWGDQEYLFNKMREHSVSYAMLQDDIPGIYSYKKNCINKLPANARVVCFHGRPRPWQVDNIKWVKNNWR
jgi:SAM-dependent methyltransferase